MSLKNRLILKCQNPNCGKEFEVRYHRRNAKYCCRECYWVASRMKPRLNTTRKYERIKIKCPVCSIEFEIIKNKYFKEGQNCCGHSCAMKLLHIQGRAHIPQMKMKILHKCLCCGKDYYAWNYQKETKFCSNKCYNDFRNDKLICPICGKNFNAPKYEKRIYCSQLCSRKQVRHSNLEKKICIYLNQLELEYQKEFFIKNLDLGKKIFVDFYIKDLNLIIECNGDYWHCNPDKYEPDYYHKQIKKSAKEIWQIENQKINYLKSQNYKVLVLWESDKFYKEKINDTILEDKKNK